MFYRIETTAPTPIKTTATYKRRIKEIVLGQMKNAFLPFTLILDSFWVGLLYCCVAILFLPMTILYLALCLLEIVTDTIFLPLSLIPYVRFVPLAIQTIVWALTFTISCFSFVGKTYDIDSNKKVTPTVETKAEPIIPFSNDYLEQQRLQNLMRANLPASEVSQELSKLQEEKEKKKK